MAAKASVSGKPLDLDADMDIAIDCHKLLSLAVKSEQSAFHFGHPPKPQLQIYSFPEMQISFITAKTPHYICSQVVINRDTKNTEPHVLMALQAEVSATCVVELAPWGTTSRLLVLVGCESALADSQSDSPSDALSDTKSTKESLLYCAEVLISPTGVTRVPPWQPIPFRRGFFEPKGISSIVSYHIHNNATSSSTCYVWISYTDGVLLRIPAEALTHDYHDPLDPNDVWKVQTLLPNSSTSAFPGQQAYKIVPCKSCPSMWMFHDSEDYFSALVIPVSSACTGLGDPPTLMVYSAVFRSDDSKDLTDNLDKSESELLNVALGATSTLFRTVSSVVRWGLAPQKPVVVETVDELESDHESFLRFPQVYEPATIHLTPAYEIHDAPRQIVDTHIHKDYALISDNLGRVQLLDLRMHFQVIRMWKGHRDANCVWSGNHAVIYSRQRRSLDVYPIPHGKRIASRQLSHDAEIIQCFSSTGEGSCFILETNNGGAMPLLRKLIVDENAQVGNVSLETANISQSVPVERSIPIKTTPSLSMRSLQMDSTLQILRQMLDDTNVQCDKNDVFRTFSTISNLNQLCTALDLLCVNAALEDRMGAKGSEFQEQCVNHARVVLDTLIQDKGADAAESTPVLELQSKLSLHTQLIDAYRTLANFEKRHTDGADDNDRTTLESSWVVEGLSWMQTYETVTHRSLSFDSAPLTPMSFSSFCRCCNIEASTSAALQGKHVVQLSDSSRTRMSLLSHIFEPLLQDTFSFTITNEIISKLGFEAQDCQMYLGNWFLTVPASKAACKSFFMLQPPIARWIQQMVVKQVDTCVAANKELPPVVLQDLFKFCSHAEDLVRAFWIATLCRDSVSKVVQKREVKTYGMVWKKQAVAPWEALLRKIRVCLLLSLRLYGIPLGPFPITVSNIEDGVFSLYELVARDELSSSMNHTEIVLLESTCSDNGFSFDPSSSLGDDPSRSKALQHACIANSLSEEEQAEYLVDFESDVQGALLLYLSQFNEPSILCAHRALLLAQKWIEEPRRVNILRHSLDALASLRNNEIARAVRHEVWHTCVRPVFRAFLFGFDDVQEIQEDVFSSLFLVDDWLVCMSKIGLSILLLLDRADSTESGNGLNSRDAEHCWPPVVSDPVLQRLVEKDRPVNQHSLRVHREIVTGCMISSDLSMLSQCVGGFYQAFISLQQPSVSSECDHDKQMEFLENSIFVRAEKLENTTLDRFELDEIESLALLWSVDVRDIRTIFLLAMYELGKDYIVCDLLTHMSSHRSIDWERFLDDGIGIVCRRLNLVLHVKRNRETRALLGKLDADTVAWIRTTAEGASRLLEDDHGDRVVLNVPMQSTHLLVLRLMSVGVANARKETLTKLHSLSVLSGTLMHELDFSNTAPSSVVSTI